LYAEFDASAELRDCTNVQVLRDVLPGGSGVVAQRRLREYFGRVWVTWRVVVGTGIAQLPGWWRVLGRALVKALTMPETTQVFNVVKGGREALQLAAWEKEFQDVATDLDAGDVLGTFAGVAGALEA
jgi:hypothetical protein